MRLEHGRDGENTHLEECHPQSRPSVPDQSSGWPAFVLIFLQAMAGPRIQLQTVEPFQIFDPSKRRLTERGLAVKGVQHNSLQQVAQRQIVVFGERLEHFEQALFKANTGLHALDKDWCRLFHGTSVPWYTEREQARVVRGGAQSRGYASTIPTQCHPERSGCFALRRR